MAKSSAAATGTKAALAARKSAATKSAGAKSAGAKKSTSAKSAPAKQAAPARKAAPAGKSTPAKKAPAKKSAPVKSAPAKKSAPNPKAPAAKAPAPKSASANKSGQTPGGPPEGWSARELAAVRKDLDGQLTQMRADYEQTLRAIDELQSQASDSAGDDQADAGSKTFEREHEMSLAKNRRDLISQLERAMERVDEGRYGLCESCGKPIAKARLQAFPGATLCLACKQREERR